MQHFASGRPGLCCIPDEEPWAVVALDKAALPPTHLVPPHALHAGRRWSASQCRWPAMPSCQRRCPPGLQEQDRRRQREVGPSEAVLRWSSPSLVLSEAIFRNLAVRVCNSGGSSSEKSH